MPGALWKIELFGGLRAVGADQTLTRFRTQKTAALLAHLAYSPGKALSRDELMEMLWPEVAPAEGRNRLNVELSALRKALALPQFPQAAALVGDRFTIALNTDVVTTDVAAFDAAQRRAQHGGGSQEQQDSVKEAVDLYTGPLLPLFDQSWVAPARAHLANLYAELNGRLVRLLETLGNYEQAIAYARRAAHFDPGREEAQEVLIRVLLNARQPAAALKQFEEWKRRLAEDGDAPCANLERLAQEARSGSKNISVSVNASPAGRQDRAVVKASDNIGPLVSEPWPTGTVTLLVTDIEGSTQMAHRLKEQYEKARERHHALLRAQFRLHNGREYKEVGDGFWVVFAHTGDALDCAISCQRALSGEAWPADVTALRVRMGLHTTDVERKDGEYRGVGLHHLSRVVQAAHGGQILVSQTAAHLAQPTLKTGMELANMGEFRLRDAPAPEMLFQLNYPGMAQAQFPVPTAPRACTPNLPPTFTRFMGRETEQERLTALLLSQDARLITLVGTGGLGKTRLAIEVAREVSGSFSGAVYFVALTDATTSEQIVEAILTALRQERAPGKDALEQAIEALAAQPTLLALDNFEQLVEEGAGVVQTLLHQVPDLKCLVTSRQCLAIAMEHEFEVPPLPTPKASDWQPAQNSARTNAQPSTINPMLLASPSVQLFVDRARKNRADFQITANNANAIAELCAKLEGIPLALELAAGWAKALTPAQMLAQLKLILVARDRSGPERHRSLNAAIEGSYRLLPPELQRFFACLSVFRAGWTMESAQEVCDEPQALNFLMQLRERSLILAEERGEAMRYRLLETLREFGEERLRDSGEIEATQDRHLAYFRDLAEQADPQLQSAEQAQWLHRLEAERQNLRAALTCADAETRLQMASNLQWFWIIRAYLQEGRAWLEGALSRRKNVTDALTLKARNAAGILAWQAGDFPAAREHLSACLNQHQAESNERGVARSLVNLANMASQQGDYTTARANYERSLTIWRKLEEKHPVAVTLSNLGALANMMNDNDAALTCLEEALSLQHDTGDARLHANILHNMAEIHRDKRNFATAQQCIRECLHIRLALHDQHTICNLADLLVAIAYDLKQYERAAWFAGASEAACYHIGVPAAPHARAGINEYITKLHAEIPITNFELAYNSGRDASWQQIINAISAPEATGY